MEPRIAKEIEVVETPFGKVTAKPGDTIANDSDGTGPFVWRPGVYEKYQRKATK